MIQVNSPERENFISVCATIHCLKVKKQNSSPDPSAELLFSYLNTYRTLTGCLNGTKFSIPKPKIIIFS